MPSPEYRDRSFQADQQKAVNSHDSLDDHYKKANAYLQANTIQQPDLFRYSDIYPPENIKALYAGLYKNKAETEGKKYSTIQEAILHESIAKHDWFGPQYDTVKRSEYDDQKRGLDVMVVRRFQNENGENKISTVMGIDATMNEGAYIKKIQYQDYLLAHHPELAKCSVFMDPISGVVGPRTTPKIILYNSQESIDRLIGKWKMGEQAGTDMQNDPEQLALLTQALFQTAFFAERVNHDSKVGRALIKLHERNLHYLKTELFKKMHHFNRIPATSFAVESISEATRTPEKIIRSTVCKLGDEKNPLLHKLVWRSK